VKSAAQVISFIFHPLLLTTYLVLFLGTFFPPLLGINQVVLYLFSLFIFVITFFFPALTILLIVKFSGTISSLRLASRQERLVPFILISLIYMAVAFLFFHKAILSMNFNRIMIIVAALVGIATVITFFYKISIHSLAWGGVVGILLSMNRMVEGTLLIPTIVAIVLAGLVMSARLFLNAHTLREVLSGALTGFVAGLGGMMLLF
jgi:membrane-associated phospholipid phosphatase